jgi:hypothetical protein
VGQGRDIEVHLYGRLRQGRGHDATSGECVVNVQVEEEATIAQVLAGLGIATKQASNIFLNGELSVPTRHVGAGDRLGVFPSNMATLYRWYFARKE